jgi:capsular polysaccharide biosynthesis protein
MNANLGTSSSTSLLSPLPGPDEDDDREPPTFGHDDLVDPDPSVVSTLVTPVAAEPAETDPPPATQATAHPTNPGEVDRLSAIWKARYLIILGTVVVAMLVYLVSNRVPAVYSSSATVSVTAASTPGGSAQDVALASNDLAAQDAQLVQTDAVLAAASKKLGVPAATLGAHLTAGTVGAQNLIQITMQSATPEEAQRAAEAVATAFQASLVQRGQQASQALQASVATQSASLNQQIQSLKLEIASNLGALPGSSQLAVLESQETQLTSLMGSMANLTANTALAVASQQPNVDIVVASTPANKVSPRPTFYAIIGGLLALLIGCQVAVVVARRRSLRTVTT